jgi:hypothetical protein
MRRISDEHQNAPPFIMNASAGDKKKTNEDQQQLEKLLEENLRL